MPKCGIYQIINLINNHKYIGSSFNIWKRWSAHKNMLVRNAHGNNHLQRAWNTYGEVNFRFDILEECEGEFLIKEEQKYLDTMKPEYNLSVTAGRVTMSEEGRKRISEFAKNRPVWFKGRKHTQESKNKISMNHYDCRGENNSFYGKHHTEETRKKISDSKKGENHPFYGKKRPDHSSKISGENNYFFGKKHSEEFKMKSSLQKCKLSISEMELVIKLVNDGFSQRQIAEKMSCSPATINRIVNDKIKGFRLSEKRE